MPFGNFCDGCQHIHHFSHRSRRISVVNVADGGTGTSPGFTSVVTSASFPFLPSMQKQAGHRERDRASIKANRKLMRTLWR